VSIFDFVNRFLAPNWVVVLFHQDDPHILKEIRSYLESYNFQFAWNG
jgi:hypothetical protein